MNDELEYLEDLRQFCSDRKIAAYFVGGIVRDLVLGIPHSQDYDLSFEADATEIARSVAQKWGGKVRIHERFKTATLHLSEDLVFDLITARREHYPVPGALPEVIPSTINDDLWRRDFSINALALPISETSSLLPGALKTVREHIIDPCGGLEDMQKRQVKILRSDSFFEDPTRLFRALRYSTRLNYRLEDDTYREFLRARDQAALATISLERTLSELFRVEKEGRPEAHLRSILDAQLLESSPYFIAERVRELRTRPKDLETSKLSAYSLTALLLRLVEKEKQEVVLARCGLRKAMKKRLISETKV